MKLQWLKKAMAGTAIALVLGIGSTTILSTTAQAQDRRWRDRDDRREWRDREEARRRAEREREWAWRQRQQRDRYVYVQPRVIPRTYPYGGYGTYGGYGR